MRKLSRRKGARRVSNGDGGEIKVNGLGKGYSVFALVLQSVGIALIVAVMIAASSEWRSMVIFMSAGGRCTAEVCNSLDRRLSLLEARVSGLPPEGLIKDLHDVKTEDRRLQRQIDRIESELFFGKRKPVLPPYVED